MKALLLLLLLSGCATGMDVEYFNRRVAEVPQSRIEWRPVADANGVCQNITPRANFKYIACSQHSPDYTACRIYSSPDAPVAVLGHEFKHCFGFKH